MDLVEHAAPRRLEDTLQARHERRQRHGVVVGIERGLVPGVAEVAAGRGIGMADHRVARIPVAAQVVEEVIALEHLVVLDGQ